MLTDIEVFGLREALNAWAEIKRKRHIDKPAAVQLALQVTLARRHAAILRGAR